MDQKELIALMLNYKALIRCFDALENYRPPFTETEREEIREILGAKIDSADIDWKLLQSFSAGSDVLAMQLESKFSEFALEGFLNGMQIKLSS